MEHRRKEKRKQKNRGAQGKGLHKLWNILNYIQSSVMLSQIRADNKTRSHLFFYKTPERYQTKTEQWRVIFLLNSYSSVGSLLVPKYIYREGE